MLYRTEFATAAQQWAGEHPKETKTIHALHVAGFGVAIACSTYHHIAARALGLPIRRNPDDIDMLLPNKNFGEAARWLGASVKHKLIQFDTQSGDQARCVAHEATVSVNGTVLQIMRPRSVFRVGNSTYNTAFSVEAVDARTVIETDHGFLPFCNAADAVGLYSTLQRSDSNKNDLQNTAES